MKWNENAPKAPEPGASFTGDDATLIPIQRLTNILQQRCIMSDLALVFPDQSLWHNTDNNIF